jgi:pimeloyl-ACP methyl ester carboxylesterase
MRTHGIEVNGLRFHVVEYGSGPPVVLLHGFPDSSYLWRNQIPALVGAGYRAIAPDLRGFGASDKPEAVEAYALPLLLSDVTSILDKLGADRARVIAHDWGAALGWLLAGMYPDRVERFAALSVGHMNSFAAAGIEQREKSWYMLLFQFRGIAEEALCRNEWRLFRDWARDHAEAEQWISSLSRPGALTAGLNWYRANVAPAMLFADPTPFPSVAVPTLGVWSSGDAYLTEEQMARSKEHVTGTWRYERVEGASHWLQLDRPERLNQILIDFLAS